MEHSFSFLDLDGQPNLSADFTTSADPFERERFPAEGDCGSIAATIAWSRSKRVGARDRRLIRGGGTPRERTTETLRRSRGGASKIVGIGQEDRSEIARRLRIRIRGGVLEHGMGVEPMYTGFAGRRVKPLRHPCSFRCTRTLRKDRSRLASIDYLDRYSHVIGDNATEQAKHHRWRNIRADRGV
jgi:hypothetical protein